MSECMSFTTGIVDRLLPGTCLRFNPKPRNQNTTRLDAFFPKLSSEAHPPGSTRTYTQAFLPSAVSPAIDYRFVAAADPITVTSF